MLLGRLAQQAEQTSPTTLDTEETRGKEAKQDRANVAVRIAMLPITIGWRSWRQLPHHGPGTPMDQAGAAAWAVALRHVAVATIARRAETP